MSQPVRMKHKGKKNALLAASVIKSAPLTGSINLDKELGKKPSESMPSIKREPVKMGV